MDRLDAMAIFLAAVETGSLSAAGRRTGTPLATVSRKISELEAHLKTALLTRSTRKLALTDAGRSYVAACKRILEEVGEAERTASGEYSAPKGDLVVTAPIVFGRLHVLPVVTEFLAAYKDIDIRLTLSDRYVNLFEDHVDLAIRIGALPDSSLIATVIGTVRMVVCASPAYLALRGTPARPEQLSAHDCVTSERLMPSDRWIFPLGKRDLSVPIHSRLVVDTAEAATDAAVSGLGITRLASYQVVAAVRSKQLEVILDAFEPPPSPVSFVHAGGRLLPQKLRAFLDFATPCLKARLAASALDSRGPGTL